MSDDARILTIQRDSLTLKSVPIFPHRQMQATRHFLVQIVLSAQDIEFAVVRDTKQEVAATIAIFMHLEQVKWIQ